MDEQSAKNTVLTDPLTWPLANYITYTYYTEKFIPQEYLALLVGIRNFASVEAPSVDHNELVS